MKKLVILLAMLGISSAAIAQTLIAQNTTDSKNSKASFAMLDTDQSGQLSFEELAILLPELSAEQFAAADIDTSGELTEDEYTAFTENMPS